MTASLPYFFAALGALALGAIVVAFYQAVRASLGLVDPRDAMPESRDASELRLADRKHAVLLALHELEFDHESGKLSDEDHAEERSKLRAEAKLVLAELDALVGPHRAAVERAIEARRAARDAARTSGAEDAGVAAASEEASVVSAASAVGGAGASGAAVPEGATPVLVDRPACPACATPNDPDAAFCKRCGKALAEAG